MKKIALIFLIIGIVAVSAYVFTSYSLSTPRFEPAPPKETPVQAKAPESILDLRPKLIEKLQQLVKLGSNGLYNLYIHEANPDILKSTISVSNVLLVPDTVVMRQLEESKNLPDEIFKIKAGAIRIDGIGINDILSKDVVDVKTIHILQPTINVYSRKRPYNQAESKTIYQRLMKQMKHIGIGNIIIENGTLVTHNLLKNKTNKFNNVFINLSNVVIDSTTQYDKKRFLFAKQAELSIKNYSVPTSNKLYSFKVGSVSVNAVSGVLVAKNIFLQPTYSKVQFQKHNATQKERYDISVPSIEFRNMDWWELLNNETLVAASAAINKANINVYLDRRLPAGQQALNSFPHQLIMKLPLKIKIETLKVNDLDVTYEEMSKLSGKAGKVLMSNLHGTVTNLTNMPDAISQNKTTVVKASGTFMRVAPINLALHFDLSNYKTGAFTANLETKKGFDGTAVNSIAEPLGMFSIKKGYLNKLVSSIKGDNKGANGNIIMLYNDLHIDPLKKDKDNPGELEKKTVTGFIANTFVLKDDNPSKNGEERKVTASYKRGTGTFFNLVWKTTFAGILKTIGAPEKLATQ